MFDYHSMKSRMVLTISGVCLASTVLIGGFFVYEDVENNRASLESYRQDLMTSVQNTLKGETEVAVSIAEEFHQKQLRGELTEEQAKKEAADRIRDLRYDHGNGYFWVDTTEGVNVVLLGRESEGKSRIDLVDPNGTHFIREMIKNGQKDGGGYTSLMFAKPGESTPLPKINYTVSFQPFGWVLGTGVWVDQIDAMVAERDAQLTEKLKGSLLQALLVMLGLQVFFGICAYFIGTQLTRPIQRVTKELKVMGTGNFQMDDGTVQEIEALSRRKDEIGTMSQAMQEMNQKIRELMTKVASTAEYLAAASEELTSSAEQAADVSKSIADSIVNVAGSCSEQFTEVETANKHTEKLGENMKRFQGSLTAMQDNVQQTSDVAAQGEETVTHAVSGMQSIEKNVGHIAGLIEDLGENSKEIGTIIGTISEIADQTNLLALNAAIEAARAGDHGKGFAVVAEEVRKLAEQSQDAAGEIADRIGKMQASTDKAVRAMHDGMQEVTAGTQTVQSTGSSFNGIVGMVQDVAQSSGSMQESVAELSASIQEIRTAIEQINEKSRLVTEESQTVSAATEEETASMHEIATASRNLAVQAQDLQNAIAVFKI